MILKAALLASNLLFSAQAMITLDPADPSPIPPGPAFGPFVPWRGIKNSIFPALDQTEQAWQAWDRFFSGAPKVNVPDFDNLGSSGMPVLDLDSAKFDATARSRKNADPLLASRLWSANPNSTSANKLDNKAILRRIDGAATNSAARFTKRKARIGQKVSSGATLATGASSTLDLFLGHNGPVLKLLPETEIQIKRLTLDNSGLEKQIETLIDLRRGKIQGSIKKLSAESLYLVRTPNNLIKFHRHISNDPALNSFYEISANGSCAIRIGSAEVITPTHIHTVNAGEKYSPSK